MKNTVAFALVLVTTLMVSAQRAKVGFVVMESVRASSVKGGVQKHVPGVIIKLVSQTRKYEYFAKTNSDAVAVAVLPPDRYCIVDAFDYNRNIVLLDAEQNRCFVLKEAETTQVGVVLAPSTSD